MVTALTAVERIGAAAALKPVVAGLAFEAILTACAVELVGMGRANQALDGEVEIASRIARVPARVQEVDQHARSRIGIGGIVDISIKGPGCGLAAIEPVRPAPP